MPIISTPVERRDAGLKERTRERERERGGRGWEGRQQRVDAVEKWRKFTKKVSPIRGRTLTCRRTYMREN